MVSAAPVVNRLRRTPRHLSGLQEAARPFRPLRLFLRALACGIFRPMAEAQQKSGDRDLWQRRIRRLARAEDQRPVVFVVGAGLSWCSDGTGVWPVARMVEEGQNLLREVLEKSGYEVDPATLPHEYQPLMERLAREDPELPNVLVRRAVLHACTAAEAADIAGLCGDPQRSACARLQARRDAWRLPPGVVALARLIRWIEDERMRRGAHVAPSCVITTNFDGLLEVALGQVGVSTESHAPILDVPLRDVSHTVGVWHVHGNWLGMHTLHSRTALETQRPQLADALTRRFEGARVCVMGYGAWDDVVFRTIADVMGGRFDSPPEILWSFFESDPQQVRDKYPLVFSKLTGVLVDRVCFVCGIDVHVDLTVAVPASPEPAADATDPPGRDDVGRRPSSSSLSSTLANLAERLLGATPEAFRQQLEVVLSSQNNDPDVCLALAELCKVLHAIADCDARRRFVAAARPLLSAITARFSEPVTRGVNVNARKVFDVSVQTELLAELLMAGALRRELRLVGAAPSVRGADLVYNEAEQPLLEQGPAEQDWTLAFEHALVRELCPTEASTLDRDRLRGELEARSLLGERCYALVDSEQSRVAWDRVASQVPHITLIPRSAKPSHPLRINEHTLVALVRRFLELAPETAVSAKAGARVQGTE